MTPKQASIEQAAEAAAPAAAPAKRRRPRRTASGSRWFGGDGRQALGFYGEFYGQPSDPTAEKDLSRPHTAG